MNRKKLRLNEFCKVGNLENYRAVLQNIFDKIYQAQCTISTREDGGPSIHEFPDRHGICRIRIAIRKYSEKPLNAIWVILHEFGHHLSGPISRDKLNANLMEREKLAWQYAREQLMCYPELLEYVSDFDNYSGLCLKSYKEKYIQLKN